MAYIVKAVFGSESIVKTDTIYQYNSGQVLQIEGLAFTNSTEFHLAIHGKDTASIITGTIANNIAKITIPEVFMINDFCTCNYRIDVFVYVIDNDSGYTKYKIIIPVKSRPRPKDYYVDLPTVPELKSLKQELNTAVNNFNDAYTEIDQFKSETASLKEDIENVTNNIYDVIRQTNLFDKNSPGVTSGYYLSPSEIANQSYSISDYIPVKNNKTYSWYSDANALLCLYDSSKKYLGYIRGTALTAPEIVRGTINNTDAVYCRFSYKNATKNKIMFVESETYPSVYIEYITSDIYKIKPYISQNPLYGKKVGVVGDSIMYGEGFPGGAIGIIAKRNNMIMCNKAISGSKITINGSKETIYNQISKLDSDCDYILFDGGVNDMLLNNLGTITNGFDSSYDESTFCGSFEKLIHDLIALYPTKKLGYISVHRLKQWECDAYSSYENTGYYNKTIEILEKWGIPICDLTKNCISLYENSELKKLYTKDGDGWHPNELGYEIYYVDKIESWMKML